MFIDAEHEDETKKFARDLFTPDLDVVKIEAATETTEED